MVDISKMNKEEYTNYMISLVDEELVKETWEEFKDKFKKQTGKNPHFWSDFMELDKADISDLQILASVDKNFNTFVLDDPTILNEEVSEKILKKTTSKIQDHVQVEIEGFTGSGKSTFMRAIGLEFFDNFSHNDIFFMKRFLMDYVASNPEYAYRSCKVLDEDVESRGMGSIRLEEDLSQLFESCRKAQLSFIGCHAVRKHESQTTYYRFFVFAKNTDRRLTCASVYRMNVCIGFLLWRIPYSRRFFELEFDYEKKKDEFILSTLKNENKETIDLNKCSRQILDDVEVQALKKVNKLNKKVLRTKVYEKFNNYTLGEQDLILSKTYMLMLAEQLNIDPETDEPLEQETKEELIEDGNATTE